MPTSKNRKRRRFALITLLAFLGVGGVTVAAMTALNINSDLFPAVGDEGVNACDEDGIDVAYTYGNASNNGIKVTGVNVTGVSATCTTGQVYFLDGGTVVDTYNGTVTSNVMSVAANVWTFDFDTVRVVLFP